MRRTQIIATLGICLIAVACSDEPAPPSVHEADVGGWESTTDPVEPPETNDEIGWEENWVDPSWEIDAGVDPGTDSEGKVYDFATALSSDYADGLVFEEIFAVADSTAPLEVHMEMPFYGKEISIITSSFESLDLFARCLHGEIDRPLCGSSGEVEELVIEAPAIVHEELRSCVDGCCHFSYRNPAPGQLVLRHLCFEEVGETELAIREITLVAD